MMLAQAILTTLTYSDHFSFPLTPEEIHTRLVKTKASHHLLTQTLTEMLRTHLIEKTGFFYHLPDRSKIVMLRRKNEKISLDKLAHTQKIIKLLSSLPAILAIYTTGSVAVKNAKEEDDIDLMIITQNNRLWLTRLYTTFITELFGLRRHPFMTKAKDKICLNLYLTPKAFILPKVKHSLYTAYELIQAVPLYDPQNMHAELLTANKWLSTYLPNFPLPVAPRSNLVGYKPDQKPAMSGLIGKIESFCYKLQTWYMQSKVTHEYITSDSAFFHPHNPGFTVLKKLDKLK